MSNGLSKDGMLVMAEKDQMIMELQETVQVSTCTLIHLYMYVHVHVHVILTPIKPYCVFIIKH